MLLIKQLSTLVLSILAMQSTVAFADAARGKTLYESRCIGCHSIDANRVGPAHRGVVGRKVGSVADFEYSPALKDSKLVWDALLLQRWLTNPEALIPGQRMGYSVSDAKDRSDLVEYLQTQK
jgi:cytochrome c